MGLSSVRPNRCRIDLIVTNSSKIPLMVDYSIHTIPDSCFALEYGNGWRCVAIRRVKMSNWMKDEDHLFTWMMLCVLYNDYAQNIKNSYLFIPKHRFRRCFHVFVCLCRPLLCQACNKKETASSFASQPRKQGKAMCHKKYLTIFPRLIVAPYF